MNFKRSAAGALTAAAFTVGAALAPTMSPALHPASAHAQAAGNVTVNLAETVGQDWFSRIGDRTVALERIEGIDPNNGRQLDGLDIPKLKKADPGKFTTAASARTSGGVTTFDVGPGVYLLTVADDTNATADDADRQVFYSPVVIVVRPGDGGQTVTPKAQILGVHVDPLTACETPEWREATTPGTYVEYDFTASVPNLSTDGTISTYSLDLVLSPGHTVFWESGAPAMELTAAGPTRQSVRAAGLPGGGEAVRVFAAADKRDTRVLAADRKKNPATKLEAPKVMVRGAGETLELEKGRDYTLKLSGADSASFTLTDRGLKELARLRAADAGTHVDVWVPVRANEKGPWGSGPVRDVVLGDLAATVRLTTDGMGPDRAPVTVEHVNHINVVKHNLCYGSTTTPAKSSTTTAPAPGSGEGPSSSEGPSSTVTTTVGRPGDDSTGSAGVPWVGGAAGGASDSESEKGESAGGATDDGRGTGDRAGDGIHNLASTGAAVIGVSAAGALLILLGLIMRRRRKDDDETQHNQQRW